MTGRLGPIATAWAKAEQALGDAVASLLPGRTSAPTLLAEWGIDATRPMRLDVAAPEASRMGRALLDVLSDRAPREPATVVVQARWRLGVTDPDRFMQALGVLSARIGLDAHRLGSGPRPAWIGAEPLPPTVRWIARDPETGAWGCLQVVATEASFDVVVPPKPGVIDALMAGLIRAAPVTPAPDDAVVQIDVAPVEVAALEVALAAHLGLSHPSAAVREASAEVLDACAARWQMIATVAHRLHARAQLDAHDISATVWADLTPAGQQTWAAAVRPLPTAVWGPAAWRIGWQAAGFGAPLGPDWIGETTRCAAGHPLLAGLAAWPILPRILPPQSMPVPPLLTALPWERVDGAAAAIVDAANLEGLATPVLAGVFRGAGPAPRQPLGPDAVEVERDGEVQWRAVGGAPVQIGYRPDRIRVGLGPDAWRPAPAGPDGAFLDGVLDARRLAERLRAAGTTGPEVGALAAVGARFGTVRAAGRLIAHQLQLSLSLSLAKRSGQR